MCLLHRSFRNHGPPLVLILGGFCLYLLLFSDVFTHSFVIYDDVAYVVRNSIVQEGLSVAGIRRAFTALNGGVSYWHPLTWMSHQLDTEVFGDFCGGHKLTNLILHFYNTLLLFTLLKRLRFSRFISVAVACLFLCHPLHVESVVWVSERKDLLCAFFEFLGLHSYVSYREAKSWKRRSAVYLWFGCALMSKPMAVTFPCLLLLIDYWQARTANKQGLAGWLTREILLEKVPLFLLSFVVSGLTIIAQDRLGAIPTLVELPLASRVANAAESYLIYAVKTALPFGLAARYPYPEDFPWWRILAGLTFFSFMSAWSLRAYRRHPTVMFGWAWYVVTLFPVIGLIQTSSQARADRYMYLPFIGIVLIACSAIDHWRAQLKGRAIEFGLVLIIGLYCGITRRQIAFWKDSRTLFQRALAVTDKNAIAHLGLAQSLNWNRDTADIRHHLNAAMELEPENAKVLEALARFYRYQGEHRLEQIFQTKALAWKSAENSLPEQPRQ